MRFTICLAVCVSIFILLSVLQWLFNIRHKPYHHISKVDSNNYTVTVYLYFRGRYGTGGYSGYSFVKENGSWKYKKDKESSSAWLVIYLICLGGLFIATITQGTLGYDFLYNVAILTAGLLTCKFTAPIHAFFHIIKKKL